MDAETSEHRKAQVVERNFVEFPADTPTEMPVIRIRDNISAPVHTSTSGLAPTSSTAAPVNQQSPQTSSASQQNPQSSSQNNTAAPDDRSESPPSHPDIWAAEVTVRDRMQGNRRRNSTGAFGSTHVYGISSGVLAQQARPIRLSQMSSNVSNTYRWMYLPHIKKSIPQNIRRMLYSIKQPNKGKGLIKEECFSSDGRLICSPYGFGFRLLSFSQDCLELPKALAYQNDTHKLTELKYFKCHSDIVVSTRFSPIQPLLASGCLQGRVVWHQPKF